jgi:hypothetical protein
MAGFYRSKYKPKSEVPASVAKDDEFHYMFSTQFESCDARRAFPCFGENTRRPLRYYSTTDHHTNRRTELEGLLRRRD